MSKVQRINHGGRRTPPALMAGEVVVGTIINGIEDRAARGKPRPLVLVSCNGSMWKVLGLTTSPNHEDGTPRIPVPDPAAVGLNGPGYLWSGRLASVTAIDIGHHIGWVDEELARAIIDLADLGLEDAAALMDVVHGRRAQRKDEGR